MAQRPAEIVGLPRKGRIAVGYDADLVAFAPEETFTVDPARLHHRHPVTPYAGQRLHGVVAHDLAARSARGRRAARHPAISERPVMTDFTTLPDLASRRLGGGVVWANDELFAAADNLVDPASPSFPPEVLRAEGPDIRRVGDPTAPRARTRPCRSYGSGAPGVVRGVVIDTAHFTGNYPPYASVEGCGVEGYPNSGRTGRRAMVSRCCRRWRSPATRRNSFAVDGQQRVTHVRLSIYPDGGVARLRVHGEVVADPRLLGLPPVDLAALEHGGHVVACSNMFYGSPNNLLMPGLAGNDGRGLGNRAAPGRRQ